MTVILGIHSSPQMLPLHPMELFDGRKITGTTFGDFKGKTQLPEIIDKYMKGVRFSLFLCCRFSFIKDIISCSRLN